MIRRNPMEYTLKQVLGIFKSRHDHEWSLQGFGMLRMYLSDDRKYRLHLWSPDHRIPNIWESFSDVHTHPWDFTSKVVFGNLVNMRYSFTVSFAGNYSRRLMVPGEGAHFKDAPVPGWLNERKVDLLSMGMQYSQSFDEIHRSMPFPGTVTIIERERGNREDLAYTFYRNDIPIPLGKDNAWVNAAPRKATEDEIDQIIDLVLYGALRDRNRRRSGDE